ncbi:MAG: hypothetical protein DPW18_20535 [Chloroflexi bacterium]|nr:hypothetical protein [Chloroflexota bacterium]
MNGFRLLLQNLFEQIVQHKTMAAGERLDKIFRVCKSAHRNRRELQAHHPTFGARFQLFDFRRGEMQPHHAIEKFGGFGSGETQIGGAQFEQLIPRAQLRQREGRVLARRHNQMHLRRQMFDEKRERVVNVGRINEVIIVQNEGKFIEGLNDLVNQGDQQTFEGGRLRRLKGYHQGLTKIGLEPLEGGDEVGQKTG